MAKRTGPCTYCYKGGKYKGNRVQVQSAPCVINKSTSVWGTKIKEQQVSVSLVRMRGCARCQTSTPSPHHHHPPDLEHRWEKGREGRKAGGSMCYRLIQENGFSHIFLSFSSVSSQVFLLLRAVSVCSVSVFACPHTHTNTAHKLYGYNYASLVA